jgi:ABC-type multidrug transport system fused ATPase/permease subunit
LFTIAHRRHAGLHPAWVSYSRPDGRIIGGMNRGPVDPRLLRYAQAAGGYLVVTVALGLTGTALILAQAGLLARALATAARGDVAAALAGTLWISAVVIAVTLPLIPVFAVLVGWHTKAQTRRQWRLLAILGGHFLDVVEGLPTLKVLGRARAQEQVIAKVMDDYRKTTMATLRVAAGRSTLIITHEMEGLDQVDEIVVLDHGKVTERGTHAEPMRAGGRYRELQDRPSFWPG